MYIYYLHEVNISHTSLDLFLIAMVEYSELPVTGQLVVVVHLALNRLAMCVIREPAGRIFISNSYVKSHWQYFYER